MRGIRAALRLGWIGLLGLVGCTSAPDIRKPPKPPEELTKPPDNDSRFSQPVNLPKPDEETIRQTPMNVGGPGGGGGGMRGMGGGGMGGMGGMGGR